MWRKIGRAAHGLVAGLVAGSILTLGAMVGRARFLDHYLHGPEDLLGPMALPVVALPLIGGWLGWKRPRLMGRAILGAVLGLALGSVLGIAIGRIVSDPSGVWAGGVMAAALGLLVGSVGSYIRAVRSDWWEGTENSPVEPGATRAARWAGAALVLGVVASAWWAPGVTPAPIAIADELGRPDPSSVESVLFLLGDAGEALPGESPLLARLREDVEWWADAMASDSSVALVALGDLIYPAGMSDTTSLDRGADTLRMRAQIDVANGPVARERGVRTLLLAGNHDWGEHPGYGGVFHLELLSEFLDAHVEEGWNVALRPAAGTGGPGVFDMGEHLRLILLDSAWWLLGADPEEKSRLIDALRDAMEGADGRRVVLAAHHPFESGGPHGALVTFAGLSGFRMIASKSGAMLQDLHSGPYRRLRAGLREVFTQVGPPDLFAGGHEHSMQVLEGVNRLDPPTILVSGSGSKLTPVGDAPGMLIGRAEPGYARLLVMRDGSMRMYVETTPAKYLRCGDDQSRAACLTEGADAFRTVWSGELPHPEDKP